jgi:hypothetical protein
MWMKRWGNLIPYNLLILFWVDTEPCVGCNSVAGIAPRYGLDSRGIESRWGPGFLQPVQTGSQALNLPYNGYGGSFPRVKPSDSGTGHPPPSSTEVKKGA